MSLHVLFILDPLESLNLETETSLLLIEELQKRSHRASIATQVDLYLTEQGAGVRSTPIQVDVTQRPFYRLAAAADGPLDRFDLVLMRKDPPVDGDYITATYALEQAAKQTLILNRPASLRSLNEKLLPLRYPQYSPPTLVSKDPQRLVDFVETHRRAVLKPMEECSGRGIVLVDQADAAITVPRYVEQLGGRYVIAQKFLEGVVAGDKRVLVLEGQAIGTVNRIPADRDHLANIHQGARVAACDLTTRDREIVEALKPLLDENGIWLAGIDIIDGHLTEVNITSPSAVRQINAVAGLHLEREMVDSLERLAHRHSASSSLGVSPRDHEGIAFG